MEDTKGLYKNEIHAYLIVYYNAFVRFALRNISINDIYYLYYQK